MLLMEVSPQTSYMEEAWVAISLELQLLNNDDGCSETHPALDGLDTLKADLLHYSLTDLPQNELEYGHSASLRGAGILLI